MTTNDLKDFLRTVANQGTDRVEVDEYGLVPRIRRRRRRQTAVIGVASLATAAVLAVSAYAILPATESSMVGGHSTPVVTEFPRSPFKCGVSFPVPASIGTPRLKLAQMKMAESADDGWVGSAQARVANAFDKPLIVGRQPKDLAVVQGNRMVGRATLTVTERPVEILPGQTHTSTVRIEISSCDSARLPAGAYLLYEDLTDHGKPTSSQLVESVPEAHLQLR